MGVLIQLAIRTKIEEAAGGVVRARSEGLGVGEELDGVDVGLVAHKRLDALAGPDIPDLCRGITGTGHKDLLLWRDGKATQQKKRKKLEKEKKKKKKKIPDVEKKGFYLITSPVWSENSRVFMPASMSQRRQDISPELVRIWRSLRKRQQER